MQRSPYRLDSVYTLLRNADEDTRLMNELLEDMEAGHGRKMAGILGDDSTSSSSSSSDSDLEGAASHL